ncbi:MAG TPA: hypothetical protein VIJ92_17790 [Ginsengibacter sp.]
MKSKDYFRNKYFLGLALILILTGIDVLLHKGMTRVLIPDSFSKNISPADFPHCNNTLIQHSKNWVKGVDNEAAMKNLATNNDGFELDVYFDTTIHSFYVYHDSAGISSLTIDRLLDIYKSRNLTSSIWFDFKNLNYYNHDESLTALIALREKYNLENKMIIESSQIRYLPRFCENGFFTSYYTPYFNPYQLKENDLKKIIDTISHNLALYPVSALSGYYFQYPFLKKYYPSYPILTWAEKDHLSLVSVIFNQHLRGDAHLKIILYTQN